MELNFSNISSFGSFFALDGFVQNIFEKSGARDYINHGFRIAYLSTQIIENLGNFSAKIKDIKSGLKLPSIIMLPSNAIVIARLVCDFFTNIKHSDTEAVAHNGFYFCAATVDMAGDLQALSSALTQLLSAPKFAYPFIAPLIYPLTLVVLIISTAIKIKDMLQIKLMMYSDVPVMSYLNMPESELRESLNNFLKKRLTATAYEQEKIDKETNLEKRASKYDDLIAQKESKFIRLVGSHAYQQLKELNQYVDGNDKSKRYSNAEVKKILLKLKMSYEHEMAAKVTAIAKSVITILGLLVLVQCSLITLGCIILISTSLIAIYTLKNNKKFHEKLQSI